MLLVTLALCLFTISTPAQNAPSSTPAPQSWTTDAYLKIGLPDPARWWTAADYRKCRDILIPLERTNRAALPRIDSPVFSRLINPTNTACLANTSLPAAERIDSFVAIINRFPVFQDLYRPDIRQPVLHREAVEVHHAFLRVLANAVEWNGKSLPLASGEAEGTTFRLTEVTATYEDLLLNRDVTKRVVPHGDRFIILGVHAAATLNALLPWLADNTGLPDDARRRAINYLAGDVPPLWPHISATQQSELLGLLDGVAKRSSSEVIQQELRDLRNKLKRQ